MAHKHDMTKLPQWAQRLIHKADADREYYQKKLKELEPGGSTNTFLEGNFQESPIRLPKDSTITFRGPDWAIFARYTDDGVELRTDFYVLSIVPKAANVITVKQKDYARNG